jgi:hypothetical protein
MDRLIGGSPRFDELRREWMREPDEVAAMLRLRGLGWGVRRIAAEFGCSHVTVRRYLAAGGWTGYRTPRRAKALDGLEDWLVEVSAAPRQRRLVRQDLAREKGIVIGLRTVERAVAPLRQALEAEARATIRFETPPGRQLQIDFGETRVDWRRDRRLRQAQCDRRPPFRQLGRCGGASGVVDARDRRCEGAWHDR